MSTAGTHMAFSVMLVALGKQYYPECDTYTMLSGICIGSQLPDLDTRKSNISQMFPQISFIVDKITKHRGATHTILPFVLGGLFYYTNYLPLLALAIGELSHFMLDVVTKMLHITCKSNGNKILGNLFWIVTVIIIVNIISKLYFGINLYDKLIELMQIIINILKEK